MIEHPKTEPDPHGRGTVTTHPAYAQIGASRVTGGMYLYGSDFQHNQHIRISISTSKVVRDLSKDWYSDGRELIEVCLSEAQWATFVSSLNVGGGVPCTINRLQGQQVPDLPAPPKVDQKFRQELLARQESAIKALIEASAMLCSSLNKGQALAVRDQVEKALAQINGNTKFVVHQFDEHVEDVVEKAKIEVNAYATNTLMRLGVNVPPTTRVIGYDPQDVQSIAPPLDKPGAGT